MGGSDGDWRKETILVVEDAETVRKMVCSMLSLSGYDCVEAADGQEALRVLKSSPRPVHLVLTDVVMPRMSGTELAQSAAALYPELRFVFMSGYNDDPVTHTLAHSPGFFLAKPFTVSDLMGKVRHALDRPWTGLPSARSGSGTR